MKELTVGKARGLQQLSNSKGIFTMCAFDHRRTMRKMMGNSNSSSVTYQTIVDFKLDLCEALAPHASGIMLDPNYGASQSITAGVLPGSTGLLVSLEASIPGSQSGEGQASELTTTWSIERIRSLGSSGLKLPLSYRPDLPNIAMEQLNGVTRFAHDCRKADLAIFLAPKNYIVRELERDSWEFARKKPELMIETVQQLSKLPIDVIGVEFPADITYERDDKRLAEICQQLNEAATIPWVLLSGGVSFEVFCEQLEMACKAGASGFLAGRALWQEAAGIPPRQRLQRFKFLENTAVDRLKQLTDLADKYGKPWQQVVETRNNYLYPDISEDTFKAEFEEIMVEAQSENDELSVETDPLPNLNV